MTAADDAPDRAAAADERGLDGTAAGKLDGERNRRRLDREQGREDLIAAIENDFTGSEFDHLAERLDQGTRRRVKGSEQAVAREGLVKAIQFVSRNFGHPAHLIVRNTPRSHYARNVQPFQQR
jgi:hypothetical protein